MTTSLPDTERDALLAEARSNLLRLGLIAPEEAQRLEGLNDATLRKLNRRARRHEKAQARESVHGGGRERAPRGRRRGRRASRGGYGAPRRRRSGGRRGRYGARSMRGGSAGGMALYAAKNALVGLGVLTRSSAGLLNSLSSASLAKVRKAITGVDPCKPIQVQAVQLGSVVRKEIAAAERARRRNAQNFARYLAEHGHNPGDTFAVADDTGVRHVPVSLIQQAFAQAPVDEQREAMRHITAAGDRGELREYLGGLSQQIVTSGRADEIDSHPYGVPLPDADDHDGPVCCAGCDCGAACAPGCPTGAVCSEYDGTPLAGARPDPEVSPVNLYIDGEGNLVKADSPRARTARYIDSDGKSISRKVRGSLRPATVPEVLAAGHASGVCQVCGRALKSPTAAARGIGATCLSRMESSA